MLVTVRNHAKLKNSDKSMEFETFYSYINDQKDQRKDLTMKFDLESDVKLFLQGICPLCETKAFFFPLAFTSHS